MDIAPGSVITRNDMSLSPRQWTYWEGLCYSELAGYIMALGLAANEAPSSTAGISAHVPDGLPLRAAPSTSWVSGQHHPSLPLPRARDPIGPARTDLHLGAARTGRTGNSQGPDRAAPPPSPQSPPPAGLPGRGGHPTIRLWM